MIVRERDVSRKWRHRYQVVRMFDNHARIVTCSHRFNWVAEWCSMLRWDRRRAAPGYYHDVRLTPRGEGSELVCADDMCAHGAYGSDGCPRLHCPTRFRRGGSLAGAWISAAGRRLRRGSRR